MRFVTEGQFVKAPVTKKFGLPKYVLCVVVCAMGNTARCANELLDIDTWFDVDELLDATNEANNLQKLKKAVKETLT